MRRITLIRNLVLAALAAILALTMSGCQSAGAPNEQADPIEGTWTLVQALGTPPSDASFAQFNADGTFSLSNSGETIYGTWERNGGPLSKESTFKFDGEDAPYFLSLFVVTWAATISDQGETCNLLALGVSNPNELNVCVFFHSQLR